MPHHHCTTLHLFPLCLSHHVQPDMGHWLRAQSVRSSQHRIPHGHQVRSLTTVSHFAEPFCPLLSSNVSTQVQPGKTRPKTHTSSTSSAYIIAHTARLIRAFAHLVSCEFGNQLPIRSIFSQQSLLIHSLHK